MTIDWKLIKTSTRATFGPGCDYDVTDRETGAVLGSLTDGWRRPAGNGFTHYTWHASLPDGRVRRGFWYRDNAAAWVAKTAAISLREDTTSSNGSLPDTRVAWRGLHDAIAAGNAWCEGTAATQATVPVRVLRNARRRGDHLIPVQWLHAGGDVRRSIVVGDETKAPCVVGGVKCVRVNVLAMLPAGTSSKRARAVLADHRAATSAEAAAQFDRDPVHEHQH